MAALILTSDTKCIIRGIRSRGTIGEIEIQGWTSRGDTETFFLPVTNHKAMSELGAKIDCLVSIHIEIRNDDGKDKS